MEALSDLSALSGLGEKVRLMTLSMQGLRTVIYPAPDLEAAKSWWSRLLGSAPYFDEASYVGFEIAGYELGLLAEVGDGIVTATVRAPDGSIVGFIYNPHFVAT